MAKIRISKKDMQEYNKLKNSVKSKINRTMKTYGVNLENEINIPALSEFSTRKEYNAWKQKASSFTNRNNTRYQFRKNKNGLVQSVAQLNEFKRLNRLERAHAKAKQKEVAKMPFSRHGEQIGTVADRFGMLKRPKNIGFSLPAIFNFDNFYSYYDLNKRKEAMERRADPNEIDRRLEAFKERFLIGLDQTFNGDEETYEIIRKIARLPADQLYDLYLEHDEMQNLFNPSPRVDYEGIQMVDDNEAKSNLFDVEKIVDAELDGNEGDLRSFPSKW